MLPIRLLLAVVAPFVLALSLLAGPAQAASGSRLDPVGDAQPRLDATRVLYEHSRRYVRMSVEVPHLERRGLARFGIGIPRSDGITVATVRVRRDGSLATSYVRLDYDGDTRVRCSNLRGFWNDRRGRVRITVPLTCVSRGLSEHKFLWLKASVGTGQRADDLAARTLRRG